MPEGNEQNQNPVGEELEPNQARVAELESLVTQKAEEIKSRDTRITELEQVVAGKDDEIVALEQAMAEANDEMGRLNESLSQAVASYKALLVQSNPDILEELITGDTIEAIDKSLASAEVLIGKVRQGVEAEISSAKVPFGAPERTAPDLSALSPREKIQYAIGGRR